MRNYGEPCPRWVPKRRLFETFHNYPRKHGQPAHLRTMAIQGIPLQSTPDKLREFQVLIRHVHEEPTQLRRALRLAFKELPVEEAKALRDWVERRFSL